MLSTAEVPSIQGVSPMTSCPSFDPPEAQQSHVAFNTHDNKVTLVAFSATFINFHHHKQSLGVDIASMELRVIPTTEKHHHMTD